MRHAFAFSVPANILLVGEYAITVPGGLGVALAVAPRARLDAWLPEHVSRREIVSAIERRGCRAFSLVARMGANGTADERGTALTNAVLTELGYVDQTGAVEREPAVRFEIDTSRFFDPDTGKKRGFGSSAVATLLCTAAIMEILGSDPIVERDRCTRHAIGAHRRVHAGRGSGYDIATSALGGIVSFTGGDRPQAASSTLDATARTIGVEFHSFATGRPVDSATAIHQFETFCPPSCETRQRFVADSNELVRLLEADREWAALFSHIDSAKRLSEELGRRIGVSADLALCASHIDDGWIAKASGAGNERGVLFALPDHRRPFPPSTEALTIDHRGLAREEIREEAHG